MNSFLLAKIFKTITNTIAYFKNKNTIVSIRHMPTLIQYNQDVKGKYCQKKNWKKKSPKIMLAHQNS